MLNTDTSLSLTRSSRIDEILIRFKPDGGLAAHQKIVTELKDASGTIYAGESDVSVLDLAVLADLVGAQSAALIAENERLKAVLNHAQKKALGIA